MTRTRRSILILSITTILVIIFSIYFYYKWQEPPYKISSGNVKTIYCTYWNKDGEYKIEVNDYDKELIISKVTKMRRRGIEGQVGTICYVFTIELNSGDEFDSYQNTSKTTSLQKGRFIRNIKAPKTAEFIKRFLSEHNIEV